MFHANGIAAGWRVTVAVPGTHEILHATVPVVECKHRLFVSRAIKRRS